ncbi:TetR/AcrR family transcriptional regulator [Jiangella alkaliphila]|uniref:DNA-binding transcriptional regulator, AcrR family n=1 Tax=Jiangella alkaliphila TaxID=419479 RepID=A0A1H2JZB9_9ACTN|nr:TetR/AcrR family transcriptional regulator [Jiangella alkaliphila]SDU61780.1 DNA-binding transcriptional regulator, AcrR family [Jiangella alkaliphila]
MTEAGAGVGAGKERLLRAAVDYVAANGVGERSLRQIAAALGTSHRMLIYHFGSKEGLFVEVVRTMESRQRELLAELSAADDPIEAGRRFWARLADPALWPHERLFFELYGRALQGDPAALPLLDGIVDTWVTALAGPLERAGVAPDVARTQARLGVAVGRGLLLDLLATGDRDAVDAAMEHFTRLYAAALPPR